MKRSVGLEILGLVDETVLIAKIGFDDAEVLVDLRIRVVVVEDAASGLCGQLREGGWSGGDLTGGGLATKDVDRGMGALAGVDGLFQWEKAGVVLAVGKEQDEVSTDRVIDGPKLTVAGGIECVRSLRTPTLVRPSESVAGLLVPLVIRLERREKLMRKAWSVLCRRTFCA